MRARDGATKAMALALLVVVGLAGMGLGFAAERLTMHRHRFGMHAMMGGRGGLPPNDGGGRRGREGRPREAIRDRLARDLELTPEQERSLDSIMSQQARDFRRLRAEMQPRFDSLLLRAQRGLDSVLTPTQRDRLEQLRARDAFGARDSFGAWDRWPDHP